MLVGYVGGCENPNILLKNNDIHNLVNKMHTCKPTEGGFGVGFLP
jgi:hypothetical protein